MWETALKVIMSPYEFMQTPCGQKYAWVLHLVLVYFLLYAIIDRLIALWKKRKEKKANDQTPKS